MDDSSYYTDDSDTEASREFTSQESEASIDRTGDNRVLNHDDQTPKCEQEENRYAVTSEASDEEAGSFNQQYEEYEQYRQDDSNLDSTASSDDDNEHSFLRPNKLIVNCGILNDFPKKKRKKGETVHLNCPPETNVFEYSKEKIHDEKGPVECEPPYGRPEYEEQIPRWYLVRQAKKTPSGHIIKSANGGVSLFVRKNRKDRKKHVRFPSIEY